MQGPLQAPFPYFGGKRRAAGLVWERFGNVYSYVEPFAGSAAVLLACPYGPRPREVLNDRDAWIANFWRALQHDPTGLAEIADHPTHHIELIARRKAITESRADLAQAMVDDPDHYDVKTAGYWVWVLSNMIGSFRENGRGVPNISPLSGGNGVAATKRRSPVDIPHIPTGAGGQGISSTRADLGIPQANGFGMGCSELRRGTPATERPRMAIASGGQGVAATRATEMARPRIPTESAGMGVSMSRSHTPVPGEAEARWVPWFNALADRLEKTIVLCTGWEKCMSPTVLGQGVKAVEGGWSTGLFLDPPYSTDERAICYMEDSKDIAGDVEAWCLSYDDRLGGVPGDLPRLKICVAGYQGEYPALDAAGWECVEWKRAAGMEVSGKNPTAKKRQEVLYFNQAACQSHSKQPNLPGIAAA